MRTLEGSSSSSSSRIHHSPHTEGPLPTSLTGRLDNTDVALTGNGCQGRFHRDSRCHLDYAAFLQESICMRKRGRKKRRKRRSGKRRRRVRRRSRGKDDDDDNDEDDDDDNNNNNNGIWRLDKEDTTTIFLLTTQTITQ